jgi:hypothetical protein
MLSWGSLISLKALEKQSAEYWRTRNNAAPRPVFLRTPKKSINESMLKDSF